jgi:hypothetical protein
MSESLTKLEDGTWMVAGKNADGRWDTVAVSQRILDAYSASAVETERERCAAVADAWARDGDWDPDCCRGIAAQIRDPESAEPQA